MAKLSVRVSPRRYLLTWGMTVDTDQGVLMFMVAGLIGPILSYSRVFEVERWSRNDHSLFEGLP